MSEASKQASEAGTCDGLNSGDAERVTAFMVQATRAFEVADPDGLEAISHEGGDERDRRNSYEFNESLMNGGAKVRSWSARPYTEPKWGIMKTLQHHPQPSVWVDVTLNNGKGDTSYCFALAPGADGALRSCYYIERERRGKAKSK